MNRAGILAVMLYFVRTAAITWRMAEPLFRHKDYGGAWKEIRDRLGELEGELVRVKWNEPQDIPAAMRRVFSRDITL